MTATVMKPQTDAARNGVKRVPGGVDLGRDAGREARRAAAAILEVLAGTRTPTQAASALGVSVPRYYLLESRALRGLLEACTPKPKGRVKSAASELAGLRRDNQRLQRELARQQALTRVAQRSLGLSAPAPPPAKAAKPGKKTRVRRPVARALTVARQLAEHEQHDAPPASAAAAQSS